MSIRNSFSLLMALGGMGVSLGCSVNAQDSEPGTESASQEIIGGTAVSVATRRSLGLIDVASPAGGCSGSLIAPDWVLTATHCIDFTNPAGNTFGAPRTDGGTDVRTGVTPVQVGNSDITIVKLSNTTSAMTWPNVSRSQRTTDASTLVGQTVTCYGRGNTTYVSPSGLSGFGNWRTLTKTVASFDGQALGVSSDSAGSEITAPGDSGGGCFFGGQTVAVVSYGSWNCANNTDQNTCKSTITRVNTAGWRTTAFAAPYINSVTSRTSAAFRPLTLLNGWTAGPFSTNNAEIALVGNVVNFRGAIATSGFNQVAFQLPGGFRPAQRVYVPINLCNATKGRLNIAPDGTTTIEPEMGTFSNAQCFTSLDGASFALATADYTALSLQNGWFNAPFGTRNAAVKNINGIIHFAGAMGTAGSNSTAFTLPAGFRPPTTTYVPIDLCNAKKGRLVIEASGVTSIGTEDVFSAAQCFTSLEGASFALNNSGFTTLGLASGWVNAPFGTRNAAVKNDSGIVRFEGAIGSGTSGLIFTLPSAFRPATDVYVPVDLCGATKGRILIQPSGAVTVQSQGAFSNATCFTSLESASFGI